ncbi:hypothetical protein V2W45_1241261, partial [Cenococcum geophilum]
SVLLYNKPNLDNSKALGAFNNNLSRPINTIIIIETRLQISDLKGFIDNFY